MSTSPRPRFSVRRLFSRRTLVVLFPLLAIALAVWSWYVRWPAWAPDWLNSTGGAWLAGAAAVFIVLAVAPFLLGLRVWGLAYVDELIQGADNRPSTSKIQFLWWTIAVVFVYFAMKVRLLQLGSDVSLGIPPTLMIAMGASALTAVGAKAIAVNQAEANRGAPNAAPQPQPQPPADPQGGEGNMGVAPATPAAPLDSPTGGGAVSGQNVEKPLPPAGDLSYAVTDDAGRADLSKIQLLTWTVLAIAIFLWRASEMITGASRAAVPPSLPDIDAALVVLTGLSQGAYIGRKLVPDTTPWLTSLKTAAETGRTVVTITGKNFGARQGGSMVTIDETPVAVELVGNWSDTEVKFLLPEGLPTGKKINVGVVVGGQMSANALQLKT